MRKLLIPIRTIFLIFITAYLSSCTSSSYSERYKSTEVDNTKITDISKKSTDTNKIDNTNLEEVNASTNEIIERFSSLTGNNKKKKKFLNELAKFIKVPYKYGGETKKGIDCSAFTQQVYKNSLNVKLPRTAREQYQTGERIRKISKLKFGDLVYFNTSSIHYPGHVGIYLGDKLFIHASSSNGVIVSSLENKYYVNRFIGATRVKVKRKHN